MEANAIDSLRTKAMLTAKKQCCKLKMGGVAFSLATKIPRREIIFWCIAIQRCKGGTVCSSLWHRKKQIAGITESIRHLSPEQMEEQLHTARQRYRHAKCNHRSECDTFLQSLATRGGECLICTERQRELG